MASSSRSVNSWVTFDDEQTNIKSNPWPISGFDDQKLPETTKFGSVSSISSGNSFMSAFDSDSRGNSPTSQTETHSKYIAFKELQAPTSETEENTPEPPSTSSNTDCKYSVFSSLKQCQDKGEYLGWSKKVLGDGPLGWSEQIRAKHDV